MPSYFSRYAPTVTLQRLWLFAMLLAIPFSLRYLVESPAAISSLNLLSVGFILLGLLNLSLRTIPYAPVRDKGTLLVVGLLMLAMAFALLFTDPLRNGIGLWTSRLLQPALVGLFVYQMLAAKTLKVEEIVGALFFSIIPMAVAGTLQYAGLIPSGVDPSRISLFYEYPNTFARYIEIVLLVSAPWLLIKRQPWFWLIWTVGLGLLLASKSYNGVATLVLGSSAMLFLLERNYTRLKTAALSGIVVVTALVLANAPRLPKYQASITDSRLSRLEFWDIATKVIHDHFLTGIGIKGWEKGYEGFVRTYGHVPPLNWISQQPHNVFLDAMLKAGPLGLVAIVTLLLWPVWRGFQVSRLFKFEKGGWFGISMVGYGLAMFLFGFIDDPLWSDDVTPLLYIFLACLAWLYANRNKAESLSSEL